MGAGRQEVKREKTRRRWKIVLEFMIVVALAVAARVLSTLLAPAGALKTYSFECSEPFNDDLKHSKTLKRY